MKLEWSTLKNHKIYFKPFLSSFTQTALQSSDKDQKHNMKNLLIATICSFVSLLVVNSLLPIPYQLKYLWAVMYFSSKFGQISGASVTFSAKHMHYHEMFT